MKGKDWKFIIVGFLILSFLFNMGIYFFGNDNLVRMTQSSVNSPLKTSEISVATDPLYAELFDVDLTNYTVSWNLSSDLMSESASDYLGMYSFTNDQLGSTPFEWISEDPGNSTVQVIAENDGHRKVVDLYRTITDYPSITNTFSTYSTSSGLEVEFWVWGDSDAQGTFDLGKGLGYLSQLWLHLNFYNGELRNVRNGGSYTELLSSNLIPQKWHHFRIKIISANSFQIWLNSVPLGEHNTWFTQNFFNQIQFASWVNNPSDSHIYIDAVDYSWVPGYYPNRNMDYNISISNLVYAIFEDGIQQTQWTNWAEFAQINYNVSGIQLGVGVHNISLVFNNSINQWFHADVMVTVKQLKNDWDWGWSFTEVVSVDSTRRCFTPKVRVDSQRNVHVVWEEQDSRICHRYWSESSRSWSAPEVVSNTSAAYSYDAYIVLDHEENLHLVWADGGNISCREWDATTRHWSPIEVVPTQTPATNYRPSMIVDDQGHKHLVWESYQVYNGPGSTGSIHGVFYMRWDASSRTWGPTQLLSGDNPTGGKNPEIVQDNDGNFYLTWTDGDYIYYKMKSASSGAWTPSEKISTGGNVDFAVYFYDELYIAVDNSNNVHIVWREDDITHRCFNTTSKTWSAIKENKEVRGWIRSFSAAIDPSGLVHLAKENSGIHYLQWNPITNSVNSSELISLESGTYTKYPGITLDAFNNPFVVWEDATDLNGAGTDVDIFLKKYARVPAAPTLYPIVIDSQDNQTVNLNWDHAIGATCYKIYKDINPITSTGEMTPIATTSDNQYQDEMFLNGTYYYVIVAENSSGYSPLSNCESVVIESSSYESWQISMDYPITAMAMSSDGNVVVTGNYKGQIHLFNSSNSTALWSYHIEPNYSRPIHSIAISANGSYFVVSSENTNLYLFQKTNSTPLWSCPFRVTPRVSISENGFYIVAGSGGYICLFNRTSSSVIWNKSSYADLCVDSVAISSDGNIIAYTIWGYGYTYFGTVSGLVLLNRSGSFIWATQTGYGDPIPLSISEDGSSILVGDYTLSLFDKASSIPIWQLSDPQGGFSSVAISADGSYQLAVAASGLIYSLCKIDSTPLATFRAGGIYYEIDVQINADGSRMLAGSENRRLYLFDGPLLSPRGIVSMGSAVTSIALSADGNSFAAVSRTAMIVYRLRSDLQDNIDPILAEITSPDPGDYVAKTIQINANVADNPNGRGIDKVEFWLNTSGEILLGIDPVAPYTQIWDTCTCADGFHSLYIKVFDKAGNSINSTEVGVMVDNTDPTSAAITAPRSGDSLSDVITITGIAADNLGGSGINYVSFWDGIPTIGTKLGMDAVAPYACIWNTSLAVDGTHDLYLRAYDNAGNYLDSSGITVTINNTEEPPVIRDSLPPILAEITSPYPDIYINNIIEITANAVDNLGGVGIERVEFWDYHFKRTLIGTDYSAPFTQTWDGSAQDDGSHYLYVRAIDYAGNSINSSSVLVHVDKSGPWTPSISSPSADETISGRVTIQAIAWDLGDGLIRNVTFWNGHPEGGLLLGVNASNPYSSLVWDTTLVADGVYYLYVRAYDYAGNYKDSVGVRVTVNNTVIEPLSIPTLNSGSHTPLIGDALTEFIFTVVYQDQTNHSPSYIRILINGTPYGMSKSSPNDCDYTDGCLYHYSTYLTPGSYSYSFECSNGMYSNSTRLYEGLTVIPANMNAPEFLRRYFIAKQGANSTHFDIYAEYRDLDNNPPIFMNIIINSTSYTMNKVSESDINYKDGCTYFRSIDLTRANYNFTFACSDGLFNTSSTNYLLHLPTLDTSSVTPFLGTNHTNFTFIINYTNLNNLPPVFVHLFINGVSYSMGKQNPSDNNYTDGCLYEFQNTFQPGTYSYSFECSNGIFSTTFSPTPTEFFVLKPDTPPISEFNIYNPLEPHNSAPEIICTIYSTGPGINLSTIQFAYSTTGSQSPNNWAPVDGVYMDATYTIPAHDGATGLLYIKVNAVPFNKYSQTDNTIRFRASDMLNNEFVSATVTIEIEAPPQPPSMFLIVFILIGSIALGASSSYFLIQRHRSEKQIRNLLKKILTEPRSPLFITPIQVEDSYTQPQSYVEVPETYCQNFLMLNPVGSVEHINTPLTPTLENTTFELNFEVPYLTFVQLLRITDTITTTFPRVEQLLPKDERLSYLMDLKSLPDREIFSCLIRLIAIIPDIELIGGISLLLADLNTLENLQQHNKLLNIINDSFTIAESLNNRQFLNQLAILLILIKNSSISDSLSEEDTSYSD